MVGPGMVPFYSLFSCFKHIYCYEMGIVVGAVADTSRTMEKGVRGIVIRGWY